MVQINETSFNEYINYLLARKKYLAEHKDDTPVLSHAEFGEWVYPDEEAENEERN
jgi:hypothetical protein